MPPANLEPTEMVDHPSIDPSSQAPVPTAELSPSGVIRDQNSPATAQATPLDVTTSQGPSPYPTLQQAEPGPANISLPPAAAERARSESGDPSNSTSERRLSTSPSKMFFTDIAKSKRLSLLGLGAKKPAPSPEQHPSKPNYDADLLSKDKVKQKEAVRRVLAEKVKNDWSFKWTRKDSGNIITDAPTKPYSPTAEDAPNQAVEAAEDPDAIVPVETEQALVEAAVDDVLGGDDDDDAVSTYSTVSEDLDYFQPRHEWLSDVSDYEVPTPSAYRFDSPDTVGDTIKEDELTRAGKRRKLVRDEMKWNDGLACFNARRDDWTGAKTVRVRPKHTIPIQKSPPSAKRLSFWRLSTISTTNSLPSDGMSVGSPTSPSPTRMSGDTTAVASSDADSKETRVAQPSSNPVHTLVPIAPPILPTANPMRASITPSAYPSIYDKIVLQSMTPVCPVNLKDVIGSCVTGWKRDGEWPPRMAEQAPVVAVRRRRNDSSSAPKRLSMGFLGRRDSVMGDSQNPTSPRSPTKPGDSSPTGRGIKRSLQKVFGLGNERVGSNQPGAVANTGVQ